MAAASRSRSSSRSDPAVPVGQEAEQAAEDDLKHQADDRAVGPQRPVPAEPGHAAAQPDGGQHDEDGERKQAGELLPGSHSGNPTLLVIPGPRPNAA